MKFLCRFCGLLLFFACLAAARGQVSALRVSKVSIKAVGPPAASDALIMANIRVKAGDPYLRLAVDDDIRNLYATGLFYYIQVVDEITGNEVAITYLLQGKPRLTAIQFQGNVKYSEAKLRKKLTSKIGQPLDEQKLFTDSQEMQKMYEKAGYSGTEVKYNFKIDPDTGRGTATFDIKESQKISIVDIEFVGATSFTQKELRKVLKTRRHWMFSWLTRSDMFKEDVFAEDKDRLADFYRSKGYIDFEFSKDVQFERPTPKTMVIRFFIYEGHRYNVGSVKFTGNKLFTTEQIAASLRKQEEKGVLLKKVKLGPHGLRMDVGDIFTPRGFIEDMQQVRDFYDARGYLDVDTGNNFEIVRIPNTETGTMDLEFKIEEGHQNRIEKIEIRGNTKTKDRVIRRELSVSPGDVFDMVQVRLSKQRLEGMQYFSKVDARAEPTDPPIPDHKNLVIGVDEAQTGRMTLGAGFSSDYSLVAFAEITQGNFDLFHPPTFTGGGQKFRLKMQLGTERQDYELSYAYPWFLGRQMTFGVDMYYRDLNFVSVDNLYDERLGGGRVSVKRALGFENMIGTFGYTMEQVGIIFNEQMTSSNNLPSTPYIPPTLLAEKGYAWVSKFDIGIAYDTRNSPKLPDKGQRTELSFDLAGPFGGEKNYFKLEARTHWYFKGLATGHVLELLSSAGIADSYGSTTMVPFYDRYYLGGVYSLRGFEYHGVSPRDPPDADGNSSSEPVGGDTFWFGSAEYSIPIIPHLRAAVFYDVGNVLLNPYDFEFSGYSDNWGFGIRLSIPVGSQQEMPLRLDYGIPLHHDKFNSGSGRIQFGASFDRPF